MANRPASALRGGARSGGRAAGNRAERRANGRRAPGRWPHRISILSIVATGLALLSGSLDHGRFPPGALLGNRYRIVGRLGRGGMGLFGVNFGAAVAVVGLLVTVVIRFGLAATVVMFLVTYVMSMTPWTLHPGRWDSPATVVALAAVGALALFGGWAARTEAGA